MSPQLLLHHQINKEKWDNCIRYSTHPLITAQSWYLDIASPEWVALIEDDYKIVMPLPLVKKSPFTLFLQPLFIQQLGIFSTTPLTQKQADFFYNKAKKHLLILNLNSQSALPRSLHIKPTLNYILPLSESYQNIRKKFTENCKRNIKKAAGFNNHSSQIITPHTFVEFSKKHAPFFLRKKNWTTLEKIIREAELRKCGFSFGVENNLKQLIAVAFFLKDKKRITFIFGVSSVEGLEKKSMFLILNHIIESNCGTQLTLDFEGSSIKNIARFYRGFGSIPEIYYIWGHPLMALLTTTIRFFKSEQRKLQRAQNSNY